MKQPSLDLLLRQHQNEHDRLYLLAESKASFLEDIYRLLPQSETWPLMQSTELEPVARYGPYLTPLPKRCDINELSQTAQTAGWHFCLLAGPVDVELAREQLARRLLVQYDGIRKGVFRYYDAPITDYLFRHSDDVDVSTWLGSFNRVYWHSSPFWLNEPPHWRTRAAQAPKIEYSDQLPTSILHALERYQLDCLIAHFIAEHQLERHSFAWWQRQRDHIAQAEAVGIESEPGLLNYLALCQGEQIEAPLVQARQDGLSLHGNEQTKLATLKQWLALQTRVES